jgi:hypothetical protein
VLIQVGLLACTPTCITAVRQQHRILPVVPCSCRCYWFGHSRIAAAVRMTRMQMQSELAPGRHTQHLGHLRGGPPAVHALQQAHMHLTCWYACCAAGGHLSVAAAGALRQAARPQRAHAWLQRADGLRAARGLGHRGSYRWAGSDILAFLIISRWLQQRLLSIPMFKHRIFGAEYAATLLPVLLSNHLCSGMCS